MVQMVAGCGSLMGAGCGCPSGSDDVLDDECLLMCANCEYQTGSDRCWKKLFRWWLAVDAEMAPMSAGCGCVGNSLDPAK